MEKYYFEDDGITPNNALPVLVYRQFVPKTETDFAQFLEKKFQENGWTNNWRDIVMTKDHYHSTTHEVLGIAKGTVTLQLGGAKGVQMTVNAGDVIIVPAGVGHFSVSNDADYLVVGGYPVGRAWDMIYNEITSYLTAKQTIASLAPPTSDPVFGGTKVRGWE